jgi:hypothetical protein
LCELLHLFVFVYIVGFDKQAPFEFWAPDTNIPAENQIKVIQRLGKQALEDIERPNPVSKSPPKLIKNADRVKVLKPKTARQVQISNLQFCLFFLTTPLFLFPAQSMINKMCRIKTIVVIRIRVITVIRIRMITVIRIKAIAAIRIRTITVIRIKTIIDINNRSRTEEARMLHSKPVLQKDLYLHVSTSSLKMNRSRSRLKRPGIRLPASNVEEVYRLARKGIVLRPKCFKYI